MIDETKRLKHDYSCHTSPAWIITPCVGLNRVFFTYQMLDTTLSARPTGRDFFDEKKNLISWNQF